MLKIRHNENANLHEVVKLFIQRKLFQQIPNPNDDICCEGENTVMTQH